MSLVDITGINPSISFPDSAKGYEAIISDSIPVSEICSPNKKSFCRSFIPLGALKKQDKNCKNITII